MYHYPDAILPKSLLFQFLVSSRADENLGRCIVLWGIIVRSCFRLHLHAHSLRPARSHLSNQSHQLLSITPGPDPVQPVSLCAIWTALTEFMDFLDSVGLVDHFLVAGPTVFGRLLI